MLRLLYFKNIYMLPFVAVFLFYFFPSFLGVVFDGNPLAGELLLLSLVSLIFYFVGYKLLCGYWFSSLFFSLLRIRVKWQSFSAVILVVYFTVIVYACLTAPQVALVAAFKGATLSELAGLREEFLRTREGWERVLLYIYTICITALVPLVIAQMFLVKMRGRFFMLFAFLLSLSLTLEKGRSLVAMLPLVVLYVNFGSRKQAYRAIFSLILIIGVISIAARGGLTSDERSGDPGPMAGVPEQYNLFKGEADQVYYIVNRVGYIPYITAIDWLNYREQVLKSDDVGGRSIEVIAWAVGYKKINLEREVFAFQWGQNDTETGSANTVFYVDAYLNFGMFGVILYSLLLAFIVRVCLLSRNKALIACLSISVYYVCFHSLSAVLFSGGLGFLFLLALIFKVESRGKDGQVV